MFLTAQLLAFKISDYILVIIFIGFILSFVFKNEKIKNAVLERETKNIEEIREDGNSVRKLYNRIMEYLTNMFSAGVLTEEQASQTAGLMYILSDVDRIGMLCTETAETVNDGIEKKNGFSKEATKDITRSLDVIEDMFKEAMTAIRTGDLEYARKINKKKEKNLDLDMSMRKNGKLVRTHS